MVAIRSPLRVVVLLALLPCACRRDYYLSERDFHSSRNLARTAVPLDPAAAEAAPAAPTGPPPATVTAPEQPVRHLTLAGAFASALESGAVGGVDPFSPGRSRDVVAGSGTTDAIRVLALAPALAGADIEASLAKFDARFVAGLEHRSTDLPIGNSLQAVQAGDVEAIESQEATLRFGLLKPLPTGGVAGITFRTDYEFTNLDSPVNPSYRPTLQFRFEQPLLQGFGVTINQLRASHPGGLFTSFPTGGRVEGILITRLRFDQARAEFERNVNALLLDVEAAYWNLYGSYWNLYAREQALRLAHEAWRVQSAQEKAGRATRADTAQARGQYELFRSARLTALAGVLEAERRLRQLAGLPRADGSRIVPADAPTVTPYEPDWHSAHAQALQLRPELVLARHEVRLRELDLQRQSNERLPDLRAYAGYDLNGLGSRLDGRDNALASMFSNRFTSGTVGLRLDVPLGFRDAHAGLRSARLRLQAAVGSLRQEEDRTGRALERHYREVVEFQTQLLAAKARREAFGEQLEVRFEEFAAGRGSLALLLEAQRFWADALAAEYDFVVRYNVALAAFEYGRGTIQEYGNVLIAEGPLPPGAAVRAVEHEAERARALVLRERSRPVLCPPTDVAVPASVLPRLPGDRAPTLPALFEGAPPPVRVAPTEEKKTDPPSRREAGAGK